MLTLTPRQRDRIRQILATELNAIRDADIAAGADPERIARVADRRREQLDRMSR